MPDPTSYPILSQLSEQAPAVLAAPMRTSVEPALDDTEGWLQIVEGAGAQIRQEFSQVELPVSSEPTTIGKVPVYVLRSPEVESDDTLPAVHRHPWGSAVPMSVRMHGKLRAAGVDAELHVFDAMPHGGFPGAPEDQEVQTELRRFVDKHYPR